MKTARWIKYILAALLAVSCFVSMTACSFGSDISKKMMIQGIGTVSYTHLDVYKRQGLSMVMDKSVLI